MAIEEAQRRIRDNVVIPAQLFLFAAVDADESFLGRGDREPFGL